MSTVERTSPPKPSGEPFLSDRFQTVCLHSGYRQHGLEGVGEGGREGGERGRGERGEGERGEGERWKEGRREERRMSSLTHEISKFLHPNSIFV